MRKGFIGPVVLLGAALAFSSMVAAQNARQTVAPKDDASAAVAFNPHELSGVWTGRERNTTGTEISPLTPWGEQEFKAHQPFNGPRSVSVGISNDPMIKCDPLGFPRNLFHEMRAMELVQTPKKVVQLFQYQGIWRQIWTDGRELPKNAGAKTGNVPDPQYYGYSVGKWDGNTFVVDTVGLDDSTWLDVYGDPHSEELRVEERYVRQDRDTIKLTVEVDDPKAYSKPFMAQPGEFYKLSNDDLPQQLCIPSEADAYLSTIASPAASATAKAQK
jgi:hypothetical protein